MARDLRVSHPLVRRVQVGGFRALKAVAWEPTGLNCLIGANGSGKTTVLEVLDLVAAAAQGRLGDWITARRGISQLSWFGSEPGPVGVRVELGLERNGRAVPGDYGIEFTPSGGGFSVAEVLRVDGAPIMERDAGRQAVVHEGAGSVGIGGLAWSEALLGKVRGFNSNLETIREALARITFLQSTRLAVYSGGATRQPRPSKGELELSSDGGNLASVLLTLQEQHPKAFAEIAENVRASFPEIHSIEVRPLVGTGDFVLAATVTGARERVPAWNLAEGALRILILSTVLEAARVSDGASGSGAVLLDEPDIGLHPSIVPLLVEILRSAEDRGTQVVMATHSADLVDQLKPEEVVIVEKGPEGAATLQTVSEDENLRAWVKEYRLGELWTEGHLGGRS